MTSKKYPATLQYRNEYVLNPESFLQLLRGSMTGLYRSVILMTDDRYERMKNEYPEPLCWLLADLFEKNKEYYVENPIRTDTVGADYIREDGFTRNQLRWADEIKERMECDTDE